jgi:hypothetical protein
MDLQTVDNLIRSSEPTRRLWRGPTLALMGLSLLLGALWADPKLLPAGKLIAYILPQCLLIAILGVMLWDNRQKQRIGRMLDETMEAVHLQDWPRARAALSDLLGSPIRQAVVRTQSLLALAVVAETDQHYDASQRICEYILQTGIGGPLQRHTAEVALAAAMLRNGQTTDAVTLINRLSLQSLPDLLKAQVELLSLFREIVMGHADEAVRLVDQRRDLFRAHLSTRAAYGYALLAAAFDRVRQSDAAGQWWHDATILMTVPELLRWFPELKTIAGRYPAVESPLK